MAGFKAGSYELRAPPQILLNPVITHVALKCWLTTVSSSDSTVNDSEGLLVGSIESSEQQDLFAGDAEVGALGEAGFEGRPEGVGKYLTLVLRFKLIYCAQPRHKSVRWTHY